MPSVLHATMLTELKGLARIQICFELTINGTVYRYSNNPVGSESAGLYLPYLLSANGFTREANVIDKSLITNRPTISVYDQDRDLQKLDGSSDSIHIRGSKVEGYIRSDFVTAANHYKFFSGIISDYGLTKNNTYSFTLSPDLRRLNSRPQRIPFLTSDNFPLRPASVEGQPLWVVYGKHSSIGVDGVNGMVSALPATVNVDNESIHWVLAANQMTIQRLFKDGVDDTSNWLFYVLDRNNIRYQMAFYNGGTPPTPTSTITVDCQGVFINSPGDANGGSITNPAEAMRHFLANHVFVDLDTVSLYGWQSETGLPIASSIWDTEEGYFSARTIFMSKLIKSNDNCLTVFNDYCNNFNAVPFWSDQYGLAAIVEDASDTDIYHDDRHISEVNNHALSDLRGESNRFNPKRELLVNYLLAESVGQLKKSIKVQDYSVMSNEKADTFNFDYGSSTTLF